MSIIPPEVTNRCTACFLPKEGSVLLDCLLLLTNAISVASEDGTSWRDLWEQIIPERPCNPTPAATPWLVEGETSPIPIN